MRPFLATRLLVIALGLSFGGAELAAATITVTNANDSGAGSFRDAIAVSNASTGVLDTIAFNIVGAGVHTITAATSLPDVTDPVVIDGTTQPGYAGDPLIEVRADTPLSGIRISAGASTVRGLVVNSFSTQISLTTAGGNLIEGCYVGTNAAGTAGVGSGLGIFVQSSNDNTIGGTAPTAGNLISGNPSGGIFVSGGDGTVIQGNRIGTTADGAFVLGNGTGISLAGVANTLVGGSSAGARNLISGSYSGGIDVTQSGAGNRIQGNWIGTDISGTLALPNDFGINASNLTEGLVIGGSAPGEGNLISGNNLAIFLNTGVHGAVVQGNLIGTDATGTLPLPNGEAILLNALDTTDVVIGGPAPGQGNVIAFNQGLNGGPGGIWNLGVRVTIRGNSIYDNFGLAIDNSDGALGINANDPGDPDTGANEFQNFPIVTSATALGPQGTDTRFQGVLHSAPATMYILDFYASPACSRFPREFLQGETYLGFGQVLTDGSGTGVFDVTLPVGLEPGARITATATDPAGNTSEYSQRIVFSILPTSGPPAGGAAVTLSGTDFAAGASVMIGGVPATGVNVDSSTQITATSPALAAGIAHDVSVANTDGSAGVLAKGFVADFLDVPPANIFYASITKLVSNAITIGVGSGLYGVDQPTLRQQMAVFLLKAKFGLCYTPPPCTPGFFADVACPSTFAPWIEALANEGITGGCGGGNYCPASPVRRDQMAVFLLKAKYGSAHVPPVCTPPGVFPDVPCPDTFTDWIEQLAAENITGGCGGGNYCPLANNTRGQMAVFIVKTFGLQ